MFGGFFTGRRVLVTGISGVKACWLALELIEAGATVIGLDRVFPETLSNFAASGLGSRIRFIQGDIADIRLMDELVAQVDCVFHLAAMALVGEAQSEPRDAYRSNTWGTAVVLEALRRSESVRYAVFVTTDKVYKSKDGAPWQEEDPLGASGPYQVSKACAEFIIHDYFQTYLRSSGKRMAVARAGNVLVGGDLHSSRNHNRAGRIFVDCFDALLDGQPPLIFQPAQTRPYTYGLDILAGYLTLMSCLDDDQVNGEAFNFGPHERFGVSNALIATKLCKLWSDGATWKRGERREEPFVYQSLNWDKSWKRLGWQPAFTLYEALAHTTRWYKAWGQWRNAPLEGGLAAVNQALILEHHEAARDLGIRWALNQREATA
jgi:CDP-glucose 4,6-dehydratase